MAYPWTGCSSQVSDLSRRPFLFPSGQVPSSEDEPAPKKQKVSVSAKKEESKPKHDSSPSEPVFSSADEVMPALPENASEPDPESNSRAHSERKGFPGPPADSHPEPSALEGPSCPASCGAAVLTTVTMSGRDPRTAQSGSSAVTTPAAAHPDSIHPAEPRPDVLKPAVASVLVPKSILAKPSSSPEPRYVLAAPPSPSIRYGIRVERSTAPYCRCRSSSERPSSLALLVPRNCCSAAGGGV